MTNRTPDESSRIRREIEEKYQSKKEEKAKSKRKEQYRAHVYKAAEELNQKKEQEQRDRGMIRMVVYVPRFFFWLLGINLTLLYVILPATILVIGGEPGLAFQVLICLPLVPVVMLLMYVSWYIYWYVVAIPMTILVVLLIMGILFGTVSIQVDRIASLLPF